ncbi:MAG: NAD(P)-dependent oxidoreductase [Bacteroidota bacterium]
MKVLVTGGSGLVGRFVVDELANHHEVEILDLVPSHRPDLKFHKCDILQLGELNPSIFNPTSPFDAVVHLAGIPHPLNHPPEVVFRTNAIGTFHMLEACARAGIQKFVFMSSESTLGFAFSTTRLWPVYVPIDEEHPTRPQDAYGQSKVTGELLCGGYSAKTGMQTVCLRAPWIWCPIESEIALYRKLVNEYENWYKNLWAWIHVFDVSRAIATALDAPLPTAHEVMFICASENWAGKESRGLLARFFPETANIGGGLSGAASLISSHKAQAVLGFTPKYRVSDVWL